MNQNQDRWSIGAGKRVAIGAAVCVVGVVGGISIFAALIDGGVIAAGCEGYCVMASLLVASFVGALAATRGMISGKLPVCVLTALAVMAALLAVTAVFYDGQYAGVAANGMIILCGCVVAVFFDRKDKKRDFFRKSKKKHRQFVQNTRAGK